MAVKKSTRGKAKATKKVAAAHEGKSVLAEWTGQGGVRGTITLNDDVVAAIAGLTAKQVPGIHALGRSSLVPFRGKSPTRGVEVEVGSAEVALDLEVVIEHGCNIRDTAKELHQRIVADIDQMTGRKVVEINLDIIGIELPTPEVEEPVEEPRRVR